MSNRRSQYAAISRLRWRMFLNGLHRKGGAGDVVAMAIMLPVFALFVLGLSIAGGFGAMYFVQSGHMDRLAWLLWGVFVICQILNINLGQPTTTFDPTQLIRFPLNLPDYILIRLFFGLLGPANVVAMVTSLAIAIGVIIAAPSLWMYALLALFVFALVNLLFTRMVFAWVDRWLATRRAREIFIAVIFIVSLSIQWANFTYNPGFHHHRRISAQQASSVFHVAQRFGPWLHALPPGLTAHSLVAAAQGHPVQFGIDTAFCAMFGVLFLAVFAWRMKTEFRGETLSESAGGFSLRRKNARVAPAGTAAGAAQRANGSVGAPAGLAVDRAEPRLGLHTTLAAMLRKEFLYLRRNVGLFYGIIGPLVFIYLFVGRMIVRTSSPWVFPTALAYGLLGIVPVSYNSLGLDGTGAQLYFSGPARLRDVLLAKNVFNTALAFVETVVIVVMISFLAHPPAPLVIVDCVFWLVATLFVELTVGNFRSIDAPKRIDFSRSAQKQAAPMSAFLAMGILAVSAGVFYSLDRLSDMVGLPWLCTLLWVVLAAVAGWIYWHNLESMDVYAATRRDTLFAELGKKT